MHRLIAYVIRSLLKTWYSYVASSISTSGFFFVFVHIRFSRKRLLHYITLSRKRSWIRRKVHFDATIIASALLLDLLEEILILEMAWCLFYVDRLLCWQTPPAEKAMLAFVCISFLLSPLQLVKIKIRGSRRWKIRRWTTGLRTTLQLICVNCVFLGLRMYLWRGYQRDASIFVAKNWHLPWSLWDMFNLRVLWLWRLLSLILSNQRRVPMIWIILS